MKGDIVQVYYPNEWKKNLKGTDLISDKDVNSFCWFLCSQRIYDEDKELYYANVSNNTQFFCKNTGKTLIINENSKKGRDYKNAETSRVRLLILSDPHNKKKLCERYNYLCGCDSTREILSQECNIVSDPNYLMKGLKKAVDLDFEGIVIQHDPERDLELLDFLICPNVKFIFKKKILKEMDKDYPERCNIVKYAKKHNSEIKRVYENFPSCSEIDEFLKDNSCSNISKILYDLMEKI